MEGERHEVRTCKWTLYQPTPARLQAPSFSFLLPPVKQSLNCCPKFFLFPFFSCSPSLFLPLSGDLLSAHPPQVMDLLRYSPPQQVRSSNHHHGSSHLLHYVSPAARLKKLVPLSSSARSCCPSGCNMRGLQLDILNNI